MSYHMLQRRLVPQTTASLLRQKTVCTVQHPATPGAMLTRGTSESVQQRACLHPLDEMGSSNRKVGVQLSIY